jgi:hypothetical protein
MATSTVNYSSNTTITMDLANLATSSTFLVGRESTQVDNTTNKFIDCLVSGFISVGGTGNNVTTNTSINIYVWGADTSLATKNLNVLDGTDSGASLSNAGILNALRFGASISVLVNTSEFEYIVLPFSVASLFGGVMPKFWGLFVSHNTGQSLRNTSVNTNSFEFVGIKYDVA